MKIFIDTNIFLDLILKRENYKEALIIFNTIEQELFKGVILDITILNIDYVAKKQVKNIKDFLTLVNKTFLVVGADNKDIKSALELENRDLEDNLQYTMALNYKCDLIISNDKAFLKKDIRVLSSTQFIKEYL